QEEALVHQLLYQNEVSTPLGRLGLAGMILNGRGVTSPRSLRVYGSYAVMCLLRGAGHYRDMNRRSVELQAGDIVLVFPELAHRYGPRGGQPAWDEFYITFDGPLFDQWREASLLQAGNPVLRPGISAVSAWSTRVQNLLESGPVTVRERARQVADFATLLGDLLRICDSVHSNNETSLTAAPLAWLGQAQQLLETDLGSDLPLSEVAAAVGLSYDTFRKGFREATGTTPAHYRALRRIDAAQALLHYTTGITNREIAETLGFADEFHFSRRFTQITGITPRAFRRQLG
ncbi:MAG: AraC family transcriptional regulator, partial [Armatimonadota bacterium]